jgi:hypothetical protein
MFFFVTGRAKVLTVIQVFNEMEPSGKHVLVIA